MVGFSVLLVGVAMIVLRGRRFIVIPMGLAILATEFVWAAKLLQKAKDFFKRKGACADLRQENRQENSSPQIRPRPYAPSVVRRAPKAELRRLGCPRFQSHGVTQINRVG